MKYFNSNRKLVYLLAASLISLITLLLVVNFYQDISIEESEKIESSLRGSVMIDSLKTIISQLDDNKKGYLTTKDESYYIAFYNKVAEITSWEKEVIIGETKYLMPQINELRLIDLLEEKVKSSKKQIELSRLPGSTEAAINEINTADQVQTGEIMSAISSVQQYNSNLIKTANSSKIVVAKAKNVWVNVISFFLLMLLAVIGYLIIRYLRETKGREALLRYNSSLIKNISDPVVTTDSNYLVTNWNQLCRATIWL